MSKQNLRTAQAVTDSGSGPSAAPLPVKSPTPAPAAAPALRPGAIDKPNAVMQTGGGGGNTAAVAQNPVVQNAGVQNVGAPPTQTPVQNTSVTTPVQTPVTAPAQTAPYGGQAAAQAPVAQTPVSQPATQPTPAQQAPAAAQTGPRQTTYIGPDGTQQTGYIINGTTYTDAAGTNPVGVGSIVTTADGKVWIKTANGSMLYSDYLAQGGPAGQPGGPQIAPLEKNIPDWQTMLDEWRTTAQQQSANKIDYAVQKGVNDLQRAEEDAQQQFQEQRDQIAATEAVSKDNQALYAERRGDRGGIGAAQYDSIMNTAAQNQLKVNQAQTKLSTDTARQIADLRAQGEFQKADDLLQISQTYLSQLISLQQWAAEYGLSVDQFNKELEKWGYNYALQVANITGYFGGQRTLQGQQYDFNQAAEMAGLTGFFNGEPTLAYRSQMAEAGLAAAQSGINPSESQMAALQELFGYTPEMVQGMVQTAQLAQQAALYGGGSSRSSGGGGGGSSSGSGGENDLLSTLLSMPNEDAARAYLLSKGLSQWNYNEYMNLWSGQHGAGSGSPKPTLIDDTIADALFKQYGGNVISDPDIWNKLKGVYGEQTLKDSGFVFDKTGKPNKPGYSTDSGTGGSSASSLSIPVFSGNRDRAISYMKTHNVSDAVANRALTREAFWSRKYDGLVSSVANGTSSSSALDKYQTYEDYLQDYVRSCVLGHSGGGSV